LFISPLRQVFAKVNLRLQMKPAAISRLACLGALLCLAASAGASNWEDYPGKIDMGGWRIARNSQNHAEVVLLGPPGGKVIVGTPTQPLTAYMFLPDYIVARTQSASGESYYLIQRDWPTSTRLGDQRIVKLSGPLTLAQLQADPAWSSDIEGMDFVTPRPPPEAIFWKKPGIVILYTLVALGPLILLLGVSLIVIVVLSVWLMRRNRARAAGPSA
jgi:hypothetical protein